VSELTKPSRVTILVEIVLFRLGCNNYNKIYQNVTLSPGEVSNMILGSPGEVPNMILGKHRASPKIYKT